MPKGNTTSVAVEAIALLVGVIAAFFAWYVLTTASYTIIDSYNLAVTYATKGASGLQAANSLGALVASNATGNAIALVMWVIVMFFWPAMLVSGLINLLGRTIRWHPTLWGLIAFIGAYVFMYENNDSTGNGALLDLIAAVLFLIAYFLARASQPKQTMTPATPTPAPVH